MGPGPGTGDRSEGVRDRGLGDRGPAGGPENREERGRERIKCTLCIFSDISNDIITSTFAFATLDYALFRILNSFLWVVVVVYVKVICLPYESKGVIPHMLPLKGIKGKILEID